MFATNKSLKKIMGAALLCATLLGPQKTFCAALLPAARTQITLSVAALLAAPILDGIIQNRRELATFAGLKQVFSILGSHLGQNLMAKSIGARSEHESIFAYTKRFISAYSKNNPTFLIALALVGANAARAGICWQQQKSDVKPPVNSVNTAGPRAQERPTPSRCKCQAGCSCSHCVRPPQPTPLPHTPAQAPLLPIGVPTPTVLPHAPTQTPATQAPNVPAAPQPTPTPTAPNTDVPPTMPPAPPSTPANGTPQQPAAPTLPDQQALPLNRSNAVLPPGTLPKPTQKPRAANLVAAFNQPGPKDPAALRPADAQIDRLQAAATTAAGVGLNTLGLDPEYADDLLSAGNDVIDALQAGNGKALGTALGQAVGTLFGATLEALDESDSEAGEA